MGREVRIIKSFAERIVAYNPIYAKVAGSVTAGILLSQLFYWAAKMKWKEFYKTDSELTEELAMGATELKNAKKKLAAKKIIRIKRKGIPAKTYYFIDLNTLAKEITSYKENTELATRESNNKLGENHETTTRNYSGDYPKDYKKDVDFSNEKSGWQPLRERNLNTSKFDYFDPIQNARNAYKHRVRNTNTNIS